MRVTSRINQNAFKRINRVVQDSMIETADALKSDLVQSQTMPFDTGELQNRSTFVNSAHVKRGRVSVVSTTPYARRLYYHPEYKFQTTRNKKAGGLWFDPYINGKKKNFASRAFARIMKGKM
jgi:hypothetical protein